VSRRDPRPPFQQIAATLRTEIEDGSLPPGAKLPTTRKLQDRFGAGNPTVQRALAVLKAEGLVEGIAGKGVYVRERRPWVLVSGSYLPTPPPGATDRWTSEAADQGLTGTQEIVRVEEVTPPPEAAKALGLADGTRVILRQRVMLISDEPVELVESYYPLELAAGTALTEPRKIKGGARTLLARRGYPSRESIELISTRMPSPDEAIALNLAEGVPVIRTLRTILSDNERPIEVTLMVMAGDRHQLLYRLPIHD
jgi:GntR family transcriptional regulator